MAAAIRGLRLSPLLLGQARGSPAVCLAHSRGCLGAGARHGSDAPGLSAPSPAAGGIVRDRLSDFFAHEYLKGGVLEDEKYDRAFDAPSGQFVYRHRDTGIKIWSACVDASGRETDAAMVLFHYTTPQAFYNITKVANKGSAEILASVEQQKSLFGPGVYCSSKAPTGFGPEGGKVHHSILKNNYYEQIEKDPSVLEDWSDRVEYAIPVRAALRHVYQAVQPLLRWRDIWVVRLTDVDGQVCSATTDVLDQLRQVLRAREEKLGSEHPETLHAKGNLAWVLWHRARYGEAEALQREVLEAQRELLGPEHAETLRSKGNLADTLRQLGRHEEADELQ